MKTKFILLLTLFAAGIAAATPASAGPQAASSPQASGDPGGVLRTLDHGQWSCALPGDAAGAAWVPVPEADFSVGPSSSYETAQGRGTYILRGRLLTFTRGPKKGERFEQVGRNTVKAIGADGKTGRLTCTRTGDLR